MRIICSIIACKFTIKYWIVKVNYFLSLLSVTSLIYIFFDGNTASLKIKNEANTKLMVKANPEIIIIYLNHNIPVHNI